MLIYNSSRSRAEAFKESPRFNRNSCSEFIPQSTLNTPGKKLNEYSPVRHAFYARGEACEGFQITGEHH